VTQRKQRVEHGLRDVLTEMIAREVRDPRVKAATLLTVTRVELNVDLSVATVYVSIVAEAVAAGALAGLAKAAGFLRGPVARKLNLMRAPELRFVADASIDMSEKLAAIIRDDEERARAAGRGADEPGREPGRTENDGQGPADHGPADHGPADHGPADHGPADHGPADHEEPA
jgi:ribosome-binding factor A